MSRRNLTRLGWRALAVAALAATAAASGASTAVIDWVAAHDMVDVPYVRDCHGILRHPEECPGQFTRTAGDGAGAPSSGGGPKARGGEAARSTP